MKKKLVSLWFPDALPRDLPCQTTYPCVVSFFLTRMIYTEAELGTRCLFVETGLTFEKKYKIRSHSSLLLFINVVYDVSPDRGIYMSPKFLSLITTFYFILLTYFTSRPWFLLPPLLLVPPPSPLSYHSTIHLALLQVDMPCFGNIYERASLLR